MMNWFVKCWQWKLGYPMNMITVQLKVGYMENKKWFIFKKRYFRQGLIVWNNKPERGNISWNIWTL